MLDKAKLGNRYVCFECECRFYDLNREVPACPDCGVDQRTAPEEDIRSLLSGRGRPIPKMEEDEPVVEKKKKDGEEEEDDIGISADDEEEDED